MLTNPSAQHLSIEDSEPIPFPVHRARMIFPPAALRQDALVESTDDVLDALQTVSRRITDLARELGCLGYFDDHNNSRPRAA